MTLLRVDQSEGLSFERDKADDDDGILGQDRADGETGSLTSKTVKPIIIITTTATSTTIPVVITLAVIRPQAWCACSPIHVSFMPDHPPQRLLEKLQKCLTSHALLT